MKRITAVLTLLVCPFAGAKDQCEGLKLWYDQYNHQYFYGALPTNTEILRKKVDDDFIAATTHQEHNYRITFNTNYTAGSYYEHQVLKHEMCHIATWKSISRNGSEHTPAWVSCMHRLRDEGAFEADEVGNYVVGK